MPRLTFLLFVHIVLLCGCNSPREETADLSSIYTRAAKSTENPPNPVIVIPGLLGSNLKDPVTGESVWGTFDTNYLDLNRPENFQIAALPMQPGLPVSRITPQAVPNGVVSSLRFRAAGISIEQQTYAGIMRTLGVGGFLDSSLSTKNINWGKEHFSCFQFDYDWRLSNAQNARLLHQFIEEKKRYIQQNSREIYGKERPNLKFDIIAHSMGNLLARYYLRYGQQSLPADGSLPKLTWAGTKNVGQLVMIAPPNSGSILPFQSILYGKTFTSNWGRRLFRISLPNLSPGIMGTYPSVYEILARTRHEPLLDFNTNKPLDLYDYTLWERQNWGILNPNQDEILTTLLPQASSRSERRAIASQHLKKCLANAEQFHRALDRPATPPKGFQLSLIAGDAIPTARQLKIDLTTNELSDNDYTPGDGIVLRSSALADERVGNHVKWTPRLNSPIPFDRVTFFSKEHLKITQDPDFTNNLLYQLLEEPH